MLPEELERLNSALTDGLKAEARLVCGVYVVEIGDGVIPLASFSSATIGEACKIANRFSELWDSIDPYEHFCATTFSDREPSRMFCDEKDHTELCIYLTNLEIQC